MPAPSPYNRIFNFTNFQALNPATPLPAISLDSELSAVKVTTDSLISNLALIQRSDGQLANQSVGPQQLQASLLTGISPPTEWSGAGVSYDVGATVFAGFLFYVCNTANVSSSGNPPSTFSAWTFLADFSGVTIPAGSVTSAAFAPGAVNSAALGAGLALSASPTTGDDSTAIATTAFVGAQGAAMLTGFLNRIINGDMRVDQRNNGASGTAAGYTIDRWQWAATQTGKATWQGLTGGGAPNFAHSLKLSSGAAYSLLSTDSFGWLYRIEANDIYDFAWGTAGAQPVTLSFWVNATAAGTYAGSIRNDSAARSYPFTFSVAAANTWQIVQIQIPGDTGGTWSLDGNGAGLQIFFSLGAGSTFNGTAGAWQNGNFLSVAGAAQIVGVATAAFSLTGVSLQLGVGAQVTPFEFRPFADEFARCQRYYEVQTNDSINCNVTSTGVYAKYTPFAVRKRGTPTMVYAPGATNNFPAVVTTTTATTAGIRWQATANGTGVGAIVTTWTASAEI